MCSQLLKTRNENRTFPADKHSTYLDSHRQVVLLYRLEVERVVHLYVGPRVAVVGPLLQVERVQLVRLRRRARHEPVEHGRVALDSGAFLDFKRIFFVGFWEEK